MIFLKLHSKRLLGFLSALCFLCFFGRAAAQPATPLSSKENPTTLIYVLPLRDDVEQSMEFLARRAVKEANAAGAQALVVHMDTNGGRGDCMLEILKTLQRFRDPAQTYTFVDTKAISAGAFIASGTRHIYMAPGSVIGGATPVMMGQGGGNVETMPASFEQKVISVYRAIGRSIAENNGHNPDIFDAMVDPEKELVVDGKAVPAKTKNRVLTLTTKEASQKYGVPPKPLLSQGTVPDLDALLKQISSNGTYQQITVEPTGFEQLARFITFLSPMLLMAAMALGYIEFKTPGFGIFGILSGLCFLVFFFGHYVAGLSGQGPLLIFILGIGLLFLEIILLPGTLLPAFTGIVLIFGALLLAMVDRYPDDALIPSLPQLQGPLIQLGLGLFLSFGAMALMARFLPERIFASSLEGATVHGSGQVQLPLVQVGSLGITLTPLRPSGTARFGETPVDVITDGVMVAASARVRVIAVEGMRIVVEPA